MSAIIDIFLVALLVGCVSLPIIVVMCQFAPEPPTKRFHPDDSNPWKCIYEVEKERRWQARTQE